MIPALRRCLLAALGALPIVALVIAAVTAATAFSLPARTAQADRHEVLIQDFVYDPTLVAVRTGDMVTWTNRDFVPHTVTAEDGSWDSGEIGPGETWSLIVSDTAGADYFCTYHPAMRSGLAISPG